MYINPLVNNGSPLGGRDYTMDMAVVALRQTLNRAITWQAIAGKHRRVRGVAVERSMVNDLL